MDIDPIKKHNSKTISSYEKRIAELEEANTRLENELVESRKIYRHISGMIGVAPNKLTKTDRNNDNDDYENALALSEGRCSLILETMRDGIYEWDVETNKIQCSPNWYRLFGYFPDEFPVNSAVWERMIHSDDRQQTKELLNAHLRGRANIYEAEYRVRMKNGAWKWVQDRGKIISYNSGNSPKKIAGTIIDISSRKANEEEIKKNEDRLIALLEISQMYNKSEKEILNFALDEIVKVSNSKIGYIALANDEQTHLTMFAWSDGAIELCGIANPNKVFYINETGLWGEPFRQRKPVIVNDYNAPNPLKKGVPDGHVQLARHLGIPVENGDKIALVAGVGNKAYNYDESDIRNVTVVLESAWHLIKRKRAEAALKESEADYRALFENAHDAILIISSNGTVIEVNQKACDIYKLSKSEFVGASLLKYTKDALNCIEKLNILLDNGYIQGYESIHLSSEGTELHLDMNASVLNYKGNQSILLISRDISKRKTAEKALIHSEYKYKSLAEQIPVGIYRTNTDGELIYCNTAYANILGYTSPEELMSIPVAECYLFPEIRQEYIAKAKTSEKFTMEIELKKRTGEPVWAYDTGRAVYKSDGEIDYIDGIIEDITERRENRIQLKQLLKMQEIAENISTHFLKASAEDFELEIARTLEIVGSIVKADHCYFYIFKHEKNSSSILREWTKSGVNPLGELFDALQLETFNWGKQEFSEKKILLINDIANLSDTAKKEMSVFASAEIKAIIAVPVYVKAKMRGWFGVSAVDKPRQWKNEEIVLIKLLGEIISHAYDRKKIEEELKDSEEWLRKIVENMNEGLIATNKDGAVTFVNKKFSELTGYSPSRMIGRYYNSLFEEAGLSYLKSELQTRRLGNENPYEIIYTKKNNETLYFHASPKILHDENGNFNGSFAVITDITKLKSVEDELTNSLLKLQQSNKVIENQLTELRNLNAELAQSEKRLRELNADKDKLFSIIAHDLRSPLSGFIGISQTLMEDFQTMSNEDILEMTVLMHKSADQLFKLLENLLEWSKIQRGKFEFKPEICQIRENLQGCITLLSSNSIQKNITIKNEISGELLVNADFRMLNTILRNLISNAVKFSFENSEIIITAEKLNNGKIDIAVSDTGTGIEPETMEKLFRIDSATTIPGTANEKGSGLGLILCKELAEINNGSLRIQSQIGKGTSVILTLPEFEFTSPIVA